MEKFKPVDLIIIIGVIIALIVGFLLSKISDKQQLNKSKQLQKYLFRYISEA